MKDIFCILWWDDLLDQKISSKTITSSATDNAFNCIRWCVLGCWKMKWVHMKCLDFFLYGGMSVCEISESDRCLILPDFVWIVDFAVVVCIHQVGDCILPFVVFVLQSDVGKYLFAVCELVDIYCIFSEFHQVCFPIVSVWMYLFGDVSVVK